jgi:5-methyltetrahydrofolate--homocysteine methyltransferase
MADLAGISEAVIVGNAERTQQLVKQAIEENVDPEKVIYEGLVPGMNVVGDRFRKNEYYVPEVLIAARAMQRGMDLLTPLLHGRKIRTLGKVVIGTVEGDLHDIGKNLVAMMLKGSGFEVVDLGVDIKAEDFVQKATEAEADVVAMSALLTTTMPSMKKTIEALKQAGVRGKFKVIIGGAPVTQSYADEIGADGFAPDAASAVDKAKELLGIGA